MLNFNIGVLEDNELKRFIVSNRIDKFLDIYKYNSVLLDFPKSLDEFIKYIKDLNLHAIVLNPHLYDSFTDYDGIDVVNYIRDEFPNFPLYFLTYEDVDVGIPCLDYETHIDGVNEKYFFSLMSQDILNFFEHHGISLRDWV